MKSKASQSWLNLAIALTLCALAHFRADGAPYVPRDGRQVLERLGSTSARAEVREMRELRARLAAAPTNLSLATSVARRCIELSRREGDPRYLGQAKAALGRWWNVEQPPVEALVLRATLKQSLHNFPSALDDLEIALRQAPNDLQAHLTRATILTVLGRYEEASHACLPLVRLAPGLLGVTLAATVAGLRGDGARSCSVLRSALDQHPSAPVAERVWALTVLAETSARMGDTTTANECFRKALTLSGANHYLLGAYADFLLDQGRPESVVSLLQGQTRADGLLLRLALAEKAVEPKPPLFDAHFATLGDRFEASRQQGDSIHQREEARFELHLRKNAFKAVGLAQANWAVQREPADARILLEAAMAANSPTAATPVIEFVRTNKLEDVRILKLIMQFKGQTSR